MLGKLIKHEFLATWRLMLLLDAVLAGIGIFGFFVMGSIHNLEGLENNDALGWIVSSYVLWFILYMLGILAVNIGTLIFLMIRYYRNLYSTEGYLTFTLPVETADILHAKLITGYVWLFASGFLTAVSVLLMVVGLFGAFPASERAEIVEGFMELLGHVGPGVWVLCVIYALLYPLVSLLTIAFCISVGQLWQKHKIAGAVVCYIGVHIVNRIVTTVFSFGRMINGLRGGLADFEFGKYYSVTLWEFLIYSAVAGGIFYVVIRYINSHKLNLD
ncbi:MAG: hypothetical protein K5696_06375 [Lachnospiraceae bacterium]|nr:hypothetical protein [Lachnospiraceae bacterium]